MALLFSVKAQGTWNHLYLLLRIVSTWRTVTADILYTSHTKYICSWNLLKYIKYLSIIFTTTINQIITNFKNFKKLQFYWIKDFSMAWVDGWFNFSHAIVTIFFIGSVRKFCGTCGLEESVSLLGLENVYQCLWLPFYWKVHWMKSCFYITVWLC